MIIIIIGISILIQTRDTLIATVAMGAVKENAIVTCIVMKDLRAISAYIVIAYIVLVCQIVQIAIVQIVPISNVLIVIVNVLRNVAVLVVNVLWLVVVF